MKILALFLFIVALCCSVSAQTNKKRIPADKQNTILAQVVKKMAEPTVCGKAEWAEKEFYTGTIIKRDFGSDEMILQGFVLRLKDDTRIYLNLDSEYIDSVASSASSALADFLVKGKKIKVWSYRCRKILFAYKVSSL